MPSRVSAFVIWALLAASAVFWALRLTVRGPTAPAYTVPVAEATAMRGDLSRLFGAAAAPAAAPAPQAASRFRLLGVVAPKADAPQGGGIALVSIDGKPARPYRVGSHVDGELILRGVGPRNAAFGPASGTTAFTLELPLRQPPATGTLPPLLPNEQAPADASAESAEPAEPQAGAPEPTPQPAPQAAPVQVPQPAPQATPGQPVPVTPLPLRPRPAAR